MSKPGVARKIGKELKQDLPVLLFWLFIMALVFCVGYVLGYTDGHTDKNTTTGNLPFPTETKTHYKVRISSKFTDEQKDIVKDAIAKWLAGVNNTKMLSVDVSVDECPDKPDVVDACITPVEAERVCCIPGEYNNIGCTWPSKNYTSVEISTGQKNNLTLSHLVQHELGHVFGILDSDVPNIIMNGVINTDAGSDLTPQDINLYLNRR